MSELPELYGQMLAISSVSEVKDTFAVMSHESYWENTIHRML